MLGVGRTASRGLATFVALVMAVVASMLIGGQLAGAEAATTANRGVVAKTVDGKMTSKVFGSASDGSDLTGTFTPLRFVKRDGKLKARGILEGVVTHPNGSKERFTVVRALKVKKINGQRLTGLTAISPRAARVDCDILSLVLGP